LIINGSVHGESHWQQVARATHRREFWVEMPMLRFIVVGLFVALALDVGANRPANSEDAPKATTAAAEVPKELFAGKVVLLSEALKRKGINSYDEMKDQVALETPEGELVPIVADWRGRAFFQDKRLRDRKVELVGTKRPGVPYLQVLMVFTFDEKGQRMYTDYWCDVCSIPMYEIKPCDCCQGDIRLRFQPQDLPDYVSPSKDNKLQAGKRKP
jgi:hypothetical protein